MRLQRELALLALALCLAPSAQADDVTDAMIGVDPRVKLQSGTGAALDGIFRPSGQGRSSSGLWTPTGSAPAKAPTGIDRSYRGLPSRGSTMDVNESDELEDLEETDYRYPDLGPWYDEEEPDASGSKDSPSRSDMIPLGKPDARPGVYYLDDVSH